MTGVQVQVLRLFSRALWFPIGMPLLQTAGSKLRVHWEGDRVRSLMLTAWPETAPALSVSPFSSIPGPGKTPQGNWALSPQLLKPEPPPQRRSRPPHLERAHTRQPWHSAAERMNKYFLKHLLVHPDGKARGHEKSVLELTQGSPRCRSW